MISGNQIIETGKIDTLNKFNKESKEFKLDFNPILDRTSHPIVVSDSPLKFRILGFLVVLFLFLIYLYNGSKHFKI